MFPNSVVDTNTVTTAFVHESGGASAFHDPILALASQAIRSCFNPSVQKVADTLQIRGTLTFAQLVSYLDLSPSDLRASLLVLLQHSIVTAEFHNRHTHYMYHPGPAIHLMRYPKFIMHIKKQLDECSAVVMQELMLAGRLRTCDLAVKAVEKMPESKDCTTRQSALAAMEKLATLHFIEEAPPIPNRDLETECEFGAPQPPAKKQKRDDNGTTEDPHVIFLLGKYKELHVDTVWRINIETLHASIRAHYLGKLVGERHQRRIPAAGSIVRDALKYIAQTTTVNEFTIQNLANNLKKETSEFLEKKPGGVLVNLEWAMKELSMVKSPPVAMQVGGNKYTIRVNSLVEYLRSRIFYQIVKDRHGGVAARVVSILQDGYLESDKLAEKAMIPAKDTREILHHLYRSRYVDLISLSLSRHYSPAHCVYLWGIDKRNMLQTVREHVATALWKIRLRRLHEASVGKTWIERVQSDKEENDHEMDKKNYEKFCAGLDRLEVAAYHLDETLTVLCDF